MKRLIIFLSIPIFFIFTSCEKPGAEEVQVTDTVSVEVLKISRENTRRYLEFSGLIQPSSTIEIYPEAAGKITKILMDEGAWVKKDDVLAVIDQADYRLGLAQAEAALHLAEAGYKNVDNTLARQLELKNEGFSSDAVLEGAQTSFDVSSAQLEQARVAYKMAKRQLDRTNIITPISGYVSFKTIDVGQFVSSANPAYIIQNLKKLEINLSVSESQILQINAKAKVLIETNMLPGKQISGRISYVGRSAGPDGSFPVRIEISNGSLKLNAGWTVRIKIYQTHEENLIIIPGRALMQKSGKWFAYIIDNEIAIEKQVTLFNNISNKVMINSGLSENEILIVRGQEYCKSGEPVETIKTWQAMDELLLSE